MVNVFMLSVVSCLTHLSIHAFRVLIVWKEDSRRLVRLVTFVAFLFVRLVRGGGAAIII